VVLAAAITVVLIGKSSASQASTGQASTGQISLTSAGLPGPGNSPIKHIVVFLQENHSFDNVLGTWCAQPAQAGRCHGTFTGIGSPVTMTDGPHTIQQATDLVPNEDHEVAGQLRAWDGGANDQWTTLKGCAAPTFTCLTSFSPSQIPALISLANTYTVSDETFTFGLHPSWADHFQWFTSGNSLGFQGNNPIAVAGVPKGPGWGCDSNLVSPWFAPGSTTSQLVPTCVPDARTGLPNGGAFEPTPVPTTKTLAEDCELTVNCSWRVYNSDKLWSIVDTFAYLHYIDARVSPTDQFLTDARNGNLPSLSFLTPSFTGYATDTSQHNFDSMAVGDQAINDAVTAVMTGPEASSTAIFLTYDDCGCFYDSQGPGRVPMVIISPWVKPGFTDSTKTTFAGVARFAEITLGMPSLNGIDRAAYPYTDAFDFSQSHSPIRLPAMKRAVVPTATRQQLRTHPGLTKQADRDPS
jgi:phospholipase C